jgi:hypothetical protein
MKERKIRILIFILIIVSGVLLYTLSTYFWNSELLKSIGIELSAAGFIAILLTLVLQDELFEEIKNELKAPIKIIGKASDLLDFFNKNFESAKGRIDIIALSYTKPFDKDSKFFDKKICKDNCHIRILLLAENSPAFKRRMMDENEGGSDRLESYIDQNREYLNSTIKKFEEYEKEFTRRYGERISFGGSLRVKTYSGIPYFGYNRTDDQVLVIPYFAFGYGDESPVEEIRDKSMIQYYEKHFEILWGRSDSKSVIDIGKYSLTKPLKS